MAKVVVDVEALPVAARGAMARFVNERKPSVAKRATAGYLSLFAGVGVLLYELIAGFGDPYAPATTSVGMLGYVIAVGLIALGVLSFVRRRAARALLGFPPGVYAIGSRMVDARSRALGIHGLLDEKPSIVHRYVNGRYNYTTLTWHGHVFRFHSQAKTNAAIEQLQTSLEAIAGAAERGDGDLLLELDPVTLGLAMQESEQAVAAKLGNRPAARRSSRVPALVAIAATALLSPATWSLRDHLSLEAAFDRAETPYAIDAWIAAGGDKARGLHKKMELEVDEVLSFSRDKADKLRDVIARYPNAPASLIQPVKDALHARYESARKAALALSASEQLTWFINQIYDRLAAGGSPAVMKVDIAHTDASQLAILDEVVAKDAKLRKLIVPVAKYFGPDDQQTREQSLEKAIEQGLGSFFPSDVMVFDATAKDAPEIEIYYVIRPQFDDDGVPAMYRHIDRAGRPVPGSLQYPGVEFELGATLEIPGGPTGHKVTFTAQPSPTISVATDTPQVAGEDPADASDSADVYHAMSDSAFSDLQVKLVAALGGKPAPQAAEPADDGSDAP